MSDITTNTTAPTKTQSPALAARHAAKAAHKAAREQVKATKDARAAEVAAIKEAAKTAKTLAEKASVSLGTAKRALKEGTGNMRSGLTKGRIDKAAAECGIALPTAAPAQG